MKNLESKTILIDGWAKTLNDKQKRALVCTAILTLSAVESVPIEEVIAQLMPTLKELEEVNASTRKGD